MVARKSDRNKEQVFLSSLHQTFDDVVRGRSQPLQIADNNDYNRFLEKVYITQTLEANSVVVAARIAWTERSQSQDPTPSPGEIDCSTLLEKFH